MKKTLLTYGEKRKLGRKVDLGPDPLPGDLGRKEYLITREL